MSHEDYKYTQNLGFFLSDVYNNMYIFLVMNMKSDKLKNELYYFKFCLFYKKL
jgi:hypothetical protein